MTGPVGVSILGSTGSIGVNTLDVIRRHPDRFRLVAVAGGSRWQPMLEQCREFRPAFAALADTGAAAQLAAALAREGIATEVMAGAAGLEQVASLPEAATVMAAIVGAAGLGPTLAAARAGKRVLLANKEALVMAGPVFTAAAREGGALVLPIDSEHNAIYQALPRTSASATGRDGVRRILLTASGGPFRTAPLESLATVTPSQACAHPNWVMGRKISVDSATMMNKGLEVIEAHWLFGVDRDCIDVVIHPQSVVHSMVEYVDGSVIAQLGNPDMRTPIAYGLAYPERIEAGVERLDMCRVGRLDFEAPDLRRFPCLALAYRALEQGGTAPAVLNAANEIAVEAFLSGRLGFLDIPRLVADTLDAIPGGGMSSLEQVLDADRAARRAAQQWMGEGP